MKFLRILAIIFWCGTVLVGADFWVEFRAQTPSSSSSSSRWGFGRSRSSSTAANWMYKCEGRPAGTTAYTADESRCIPVTSYEERINIHMTCNFYSVYRPRLQGQTIHFSDHRRAHEEVIWYVGYKNDDIDHPNFAPALGEDLTDFRTIVQQMAANFFVPQQWVHALSQHLVMTNVLRISEQVTLLYPQLEAYGNALIRVTQLYDQINQNGSEERIEALVEAMKVLLKKMVDPCALMSEGNRVHVANLLCGYYCKFLHVVARHFGPTSNRCSSPAGGVCSERVCTCSPEELEHPFQGCPTTPMQLCNNEVRTRLNLFNP